MSKMNAELAQLSVGDGDGDGDGDGAANNKAKGKQEEEQQQGGEVNLQVHDFVASSEPKKTIVKVTMLQDVKDHGDGKQFHSYNVGIVSLSGIVSQSAIEDDEETIREYEEYARLPWVEKLKRQEEEFVRKWEEWEAAHRE